MTQQIYTFTSESVSAGHPDKVCDQISDRIVDAYLGQDPNARVAVETLVTSGKVVLAGEVSSTVHIDHENLKQIARDTIRDIGYDQSGFSWKTVDIDVYVHGQSSDIAQGVDVGVKVADMSSVAAGGSGDLNRSEVADGEGAGDQGIMFGYAVNETPELMPAPIYYSHRLIESLYRAWRSGQEPLLGPDAKSQLSIQYRDGKPVHVDTVVVSTQHQEEATQAQVRERVLEHINQSVPSKWINADTRVLVNPTGKFVIGGPHGDAGLTGRKIVVDTYGGAAPHGGGAFSGKDPSKVDRSAAYAARYLAKNIVRAGICSRCLLQVGYAIGVSEPVSLYVEMDKDAKVEAEKLVEILPQVCDLRPSAIRSRLNLHRPIYAPTAAFGHFGREFDASTGQFSWEQTDLVADIIRALGL